MSEEQKLIMDATAKMTVNQLRDILRYIKFVQYESENIDKAPEHLVIKDDEDFVQKIKEGMEDTEEISFEDVIEKMERKIMMQRGDNIE